MDAFLKISFKHFKAIQIVFGVLFLLALFFFVLSEHNDGILDKSARPYASLVIFGLFLMAMFMPLIRLANTDGPKALHVLTVWVIAGLVFFGWAMYYWLLNGFTQENQSRLLNLPPALIALLGALYGLYVNYQVNLRHQRTKAAFDLMMTTRTNAEFSRNMTAFRKVYPVGATIPRDDAQYFSNPPRESGLDEPCKEKVEALAALKYLLNFYEYTAVWIHRKEVDEDLIYEVTAGGVIKLFDQAEQIIAAHRSGATNSREGKHLAELVSEWRTRRVNEDQASAAAGRQPS